MRDSTSAIDAAIAAIAPPDATAGARAASLQDRLTKPPGALGRLEELHIWAAGVSGHAAPTILDPNIVVAAADHGVTDERVSAYPQAVTAQMVRNILAGGAAVNVLAAHAGARVVVVDCGVATAIEDDRLLVRKVSSGSANIAYGPAMSRDDAEQLVASGIRFGRGAGGDGCPTGGLHVIGLGDMGIGNTTIAAALTTVLCGAPVRAVVGRGTGVDDDAYARKVAAIEQAIATSHPSAGDALDTLAKVGGGEIAFLAGVCLGAAVVRAAVVLDGFPTTAAALIAAKLQPVAKDYMLASHLSAEPGHAVAFDHLGLRPLLDLQLRLGEGTGAALAISLLAAALRIPRDMATFESAGVSESDTAVRLEQ